MQQPRSSNRDGGVPRPPPPGSRPPGASPARHVAEADRPLPPPPGPRRPIAASPTQRATERESPMPRPPPIASPEQYDTERRPLRRPPGQYQSAPRWPYSEDQHHQLPTSRPPRSSSALASCLAATAFPLPATGGAGPALFLLFRPRPPDIAVAAVRLPSFAAANGTVAFTFEQTAVVRNPNRSPLAHFDSSLRVAYAGGELGYVYIPAGLIDGGRAKDMSASFDVPAFPAATPQTTMVATSAAATVANNNVAPPLVMEVESLLLVKGRVTMLRVLTHRVQAAKVCRVGVSPIDGRVLGFRC